MSRNQVEAIQEKELDDAFRYWSGLEIDSWTNPEEGNERIFYLQVISICRRAIADKKKAVKFEEHGCMACGGPVLETSHICVWCGKDHSHFL